MQELIAAEVCKKNCTEQVLTANWHHEKFCIILYDGGRQSEVVQARRRSQTITDEAFSHVYKNNHIFKDFVKVLSSSGESQPEVA